MIYSPATALTTLGSSVGIIDIAQLGVSANDQFTNSNLASFINSTVQADDFFHIVIEAGSGNWVTQDTVITAIMDDDNFSFELGNEYVRPLQGYGNSAIGAVTRDVGGLAKAASQSYQEVTGTALYSKIIYTPIWKQTKIPKFNVRVRLIATGDPINEVELPILVLAKLLLPYNLSNFKAYSPGPYIDLSHFSGLADVSSVQQLSNIVNTAGNIDPTSLISFNKSFNISLVAGDLFVAPSVILTSARVTLPNTRTTYGNTSNVNIPGVISNIDSIQQAVTSTLNSGGKFYREATLELTFESVYPPEVASGNDLGSLILFPSKNYTT